MWLLEMWRRISEDEFNKHLILTWYEKQCLKQTSCVRGPVWLTYIWFICRDNCTPGRRSHLLPTFVPRSCRWSLPVLCRMWPLLGMLWWGTDWWLLLRWGKRVWWCGEEMCGSFDHMSFYAWLDTLSTPGDDNGTSLGNWMAWDCDIWPAIWRRYMQSIKFYQAYIRFIRMARVC